MPCMAEKATGSNLFKSKNMYAYQAHAPRGQQGDDMGVVHLEGKAFGKLAEGKAMLRPCGCLGLVLMGLFGDDF